MQVTKRPSRIPEPFWREGDNFERLWKQLTNWPSQWSGIVAEPTAWMPAVEMVEKDEELVLTAELPGVKFEDVEIDLEDNFLTIRGEKKDEKEKEGRRYHVWERSYGSFERAFTLPRTVDPENIKAQYDDGILTVHLPKTKEARGRKIAIESGTKK